MDGPIDFPDHLDQRAATRTRDLRHLFWQNVVQEALTAFDRRLASTPELGDGRVAVLTRNGERIPLKRVFPVFACSVPAGSDRRPLSLAVQCTVFEIHTPQGEVFTLPLEEIRGLHALTEELINQLKAMTDENGEKSDEPFGFAAFTSLAREQENEQSRPRRNNPDHPS